MSWPWSELGLPGPADLQSIRRAYAQRLKTTHPEEDPEGFQRLHAAYQEAGRRARQKARSAQAEPSPAGSPAPERERPPESRGGGEDAEPRKRSDAPRKPPERSEETSQEADWDYDELLKRREAPQKPPEQPEEAPQDTGWDYERLFAEGEAEAQEARRRKLEELREKNRARWTRQERDQRRRAEEEEESWAAVMAAAHALELLHSTGAPLPQWRRFLESPVFWNVRANLDFVFALEDFLEQHPDVSPEARRAIFAAYEACNASRYPMYNRLYKLLNVGQKAKRQMAKQKSGRRLWWRTLAPWRKAVLAACGVVLGLCVLVIWCCAPAGDFDSPEKEPEIPWAEQAPQWLEEDYGEPFVSGPSENVFAPASEPNLYFWAVRNGKRSLHWNGYRTNYPYVRVRQALEAFSEERELPLELGRFSGDIGSAPEAYLFDLPLLGAEEDITALGEELERLAGLSWHQPYAASSRTGDSVSAVGYQVYLCHKGLAFYEARAPKDFQAEEALSLYAQAGPAFCRYLLENTGLAAEHLGEGAYVLLDQETVEIDGNAFFQVAGADEAGGEVRVRYFLASGGGMLFCVPSEKAGRIHSVVDLYRGTPRHFQLDKIGLVIVTDQVPKP